MAGTGVEVIITLPIRTPYKRGFVNYTHGAEMWAYTPLFIEHVDASNIKLISWNSNTQGYNADACIFNYLVIGY